LSTIFHAPRQQSVVYGSLFRQSTAERLQSAFAGVIAIVWWLRPEVYDYSRILNDSLLFYEAHRIGGAVWQLMLIRMGTWVLTAS
jgi:hypothetical protein